MRRATSLASLLGALALAAAACGGIPADEEPTLIARDEVPSELLENPSTTVANDGERVAIFLVLSDERTDELLIPCEVPLIESGGPSARAELQANAALTSLIDFNAAESQDCGTFTSAIPPDLELLDATLDGSTLDVDVSNLGTVELASQRRAIAQIVFTATELDGIDRVRFRLDGEYSPVPVGERTAEATAAIGRDDFPKFADSPFSSTTTAPAAPAPPALGLPPTLPAQAEQPG